MTRFARGQTLIIAVIFFAVLLVTIPVMVYMNNWTMRHSVQSLSRKRAISVAEEGLATAKSVLADSLNWTAIFTPPLGQAYGNYGNIVFKSPSGGRFRVRCTMDAALAPYQVRVAVSSLKPDGQPDQAVEAVFSRKTLAVILPDGTEARIALWLENTLGGTVPTLAAGSVLDVRMGAIVQRSETGVLNVTNTPMDVPPFYTRKFSAGTINRTVVPPSTSDNREYWTRAAVGFGFPIDDALYQASAAGATGVTEPACASCAANPPNSGYFDSVGGNTAVFVTGVDPGYKLPTGAPQTVIYVRGNAQFGDGSFDFKNIGNPINGAMIVEQNLTIQGMGGNFADSTTWPPGGVSLANFRMPIDFRREWPFGGFPLDAPNSTITSPTAIHYRGFLWVKGDLTVKANNKYYLSGVLRVDGRLILEANAELHVYYDDEVASRIYMSSYEIMTDARRTVQAF